MFSVIVFTRFLNNKNRRDFMVIYKCRNWNSPAIVKGNVLSKRKRSQETRGRPSLKKCAFLLPEILN